VLDLALLRVPDPVHLQLPDLVLLQVLVLVLAPVLRRVASQARLRAVFPALALARPKVQRPALGLAPCLVLLLVPPPVLVLVLLRAPRPAHSLALYPVRVPALHRATHRAWLIRPRLVSCSPSSRSPSSSRSLSPTIEGEAAPSDAPSSSPRESATPKFRSLAPRLAQFPVHLPV
jgi:hypothetical protein